MEIVLINSMNEKIMESFTDKQKEEIEKRIAEYKEEVQEEKENKRKRPKKEIEDIMLKQNVTKEEARQIWKDSKTK